jgi:hypothetical protein
MSGFKYTVILVHMCVPMEIRATSNKRTPGDDKKNLRPVKQVFMWNIHFYFNTVHTHF